MDWLVLMGAGLLEVAFTTSMKLSDVGLKLIDDRYVQAQETQVAAPTTDDE